MQVTQLHYLGWPDHGVPANAISMVNFIRQVRKIHPPFHQPPLLVHCSAGVGRTGAFIMLDSMMQRIEAEGNVNIYEFLGDLRKQRTMMVQNEVRIHRNSHCCTFVEGWWKNLPEINNCTDSTRPSMCSSMMPCVSLSFVETLRLLL